MKKRKTTRKRKTIKKVKHVTFFGGNGNCTNHVALFSKGPEVQQIYGGKKKQTRKRRKKKILKKKGGSFSDLWTNLVNPINLVTTNPTDQPAITDYYSTNPSKI